MAYKREIGFFVTSPLHCNQRFVAFARMVPSMRSEGIEKGGIATLARA